MTPKAPSELNARIRTRKILPVATAAAAAVSLAGCGMLPQNSAVAPPPNPEQQEAARRVQSFTTDIDQALDKVDRERLRLAAQQQAKAAATPPATSPAAVAVTPATAPATPTATPPADAGQAPVILASSAAGPAAAPATPAKTTTPPADPASTPVVTPVKTAAIPTDAAPNTTPLPKDVPAKSSGIVAGTAVASAAPTAGENSVITPMTPVTATSVSAMGSMTALLATPPAPVQVATIAPVQAVPAEPTIDQALAVVRKNVADHPTLATALALALLDNGGGKSANSADPAQALNDNDKKILGDLLTAFEAMKTQPPESAATLADRAAPLLDAQKKWQADADLALPRLVLASRVDSFGVYTTVDAKFEQGKRHTVIIYCEVANFSAKKGDDGWFTTDLEQQETLITDDGLLIWRPNAEEISDRSMNQRHDFYLVKKLTIPENLAAGKYTLRMSVTDKNASKRSMVSMPIEIVGN